MREVGRTIAAEAQLTSGNLKRPEHSVAQSAAVVAAPPAKPATTLLSSLYQAYEASSAEPGARKIFIRNIADEVPDSLMESLLIENGEITYWKRTKNEQGKPVTFGTAEFQSIEGALKAIRLIPKIVIFDKKLEVSYSQKTGSLISDFVQYKKALISSQQPEISEEELDEEVTRQLSDKEDAILRKLRLIVEKFQQHKDKIVKSSMIEKGLILAATEEKLGLFKQKFDLMNEKELNESYWRAVEDWKKKEEEWERQIAREVEAEKGMHRRKLELIEAELKVREEDLAIRDDRQEASARRVRELREQLLREDLEMAGPKVSISLQELEGVRKPPGPAKETSEEKHSQGRKRVKPEIIPLEPTAKTQVSQPQHQPEENHLPTIVFDLQLPLQTDVKSTTPTAHSPKIDERQFEEPAPIAFDNRGASAAAAINKLSQKVQESQEQYESFEKMLFR